MDDLTMAGGFVDPAAGSTSSSAFNDAWLAARLGNAIDIGVDRIVNGPQTIWNGTQYGMGPDGRLYTVGMPTGATVVNPQGNLGMLMLIVLGVLIFSERK